MSGGIKFVSRFESPPAPPVYDDLSCMILPSPSASPVGELPIWTCGPSSSLRPMTLAVHHSLGFGHAEESDESDESMSFLNNIKPVKVPTTPTRRNLPSHENLSSPQP